MNKREIEILNILWKAGRPLTSSDIVTLSQTRLSQSTVMAVLRILLNLNYIQVVGTTYSGNVLSRTYIPTEQSRTAVLNYFKEVCSMFSFIISNEELIAELSQK